VLATRMQDHTEPTPSITNRNQENTGEAVPQTEMHPDSVQPTNSEHPQLALATTALGPTKPKQFITDQNGGSAEGVVPQGG